MNLIDLIDMTRRYLGYDRVLSDTEIIYYLNLAQERVSRDLEIPRTFSWAISPTPLPLPTNIWGDLLISLGWVEDTTPNARTVTLPILSVGEANDRYPGWSERAPDSSKPEFVVYDPGNITAAIEVVPQQTTAYKYLVEGVIRPGAMGNPTDTPFNNDPSLHGFHYLLPLYAAHLAWGEIKTQNAMVERAYYLKEYNDRVQSEWGHLRTNKIKLTNSFFRSFITGG